ncbi:MAG: DUF3606 domain-containing protein [Usitatibacter sp.]
MDPHSRNHGPGRNAPPHEPPRVSAEAPDAQAPHAQDHWRVNLAENWELSFWSREFGCDESQLRRAVAEVGDKAGAVRAFLLGPRSFS